MTFTEALVFYFVFGASIAVALYVQGSAASARERPLRILGAFFFWPIYLPLLLEKQPSAETRTHVSASSASGPDVWAIAIAQVEAELDTALRSLDGWTENVLSDERQRLRELRTAWRVQADRIRDLDQLLIEPKAVADEGLVPETSSAPLRSERQLESDRARAENLQRLRDLRQRMRDDLLGTLAWVRELVTMIHLAKFSGAPASRAEELVTQIAAAVEGLREASAFGNSAGPVEPMAAASVTR